MKVLSQPGLRRRSHSLHKRHGIVTFPCCHVLQGTRRSQCQPRGKMNTKRILLVEDEPAIRQLLAFILRPAGYEVAESADAVSAIAEVGRCQPNLVMLDWQLPDMDG